MILFHPAILLHHRCTHSSCSDSQPADNKVRDIDLLAQPDYTYIVGVEYDRVPVIDRYELDGLEYIHGDIMALKKIVLYDLDFLDLDFLPLAYENPEIGDLPFEVCYCQCTISIPGLGGL